MTFKLIIVGIMIIALLGGAYLLLNGLQLLGAQNTDAIISTNDTTANVNQGYVDDIDIITKSQNTELQAALYQAGINDSLVDVDTDRVYVAYELPEGTDPNMMQRYVMGAAADTSPDSKTIIVLQYINDVPSTIWTVSMDNFKAYVNGNLTIDEFETKIGKKNY